MESEFQNRKSNRQNVLLKSKIDVGSYYFEALAYDLSLSGAKIKLNLPLERGSDFVISFRDSKHIPSKVSWVKNGFMGLEFKYSPDRVKSIFGSLGERLE
ncbi:MAG: PilZ domain-containing protein [Kordiimonadaceae bacterium]|nr:PilZ domain-containing protein [Kordiimonadaceae bacterium]MBT6036441.1 PilZ domain-containing protein [Kordiimonadaceae bacterium]MBT6329298.1 PilZ domain-containing protein [Kordiimonadaceae bacterium]MBT7582718.1 PilZ domain-containing protein [Kordiimonadaceae bacterium]